VAWSVDLCRCVKASASWYDRRSVIAVIDLFVSSREGIYIKAIRVQKVGQLLAPVNIYSLLKAQLCPDLKQALDHLKWCKTFVGVPESCHLYFGASGLRAPVIVYDYATASKVVSTICFRPTSLHIITRHYTFKTKLIARLARIKLRWSQLSPKEPPMRSKFLQFFAACLTITLIFIGSSFSQQRDDALAAAAGDRYVISAKAGHVNFVEGSVGIVRKEGRSGLLLRGDKLAIGDRVSTGADGKVEILLNPGSFVRLGGLSAFEFESTDLDDLQLRIDSGSAILEVYATEDFTVSIQTPKAFYKLVSTGVYRIDVPERGDTRLAVWKGLAEVGEDGELVKAGLAATTGSNGTPAVAKFDRDEKDAFDIWSKQRGKELTKVNARLRNVDLRPGLINSWGSEWNVFGSFGLWIFDPFFGGYSFLPFGHRWRSPYGFGYNNCMGYYNLPMVVYGSPPVAHHTPTGQAPTSGGTSMPAHTPIMTAGDRLSVPPFVRIQETMGGGGRSITDHGGSTYDSGQSSSPSNSSPSYSPPPSSPPPSSDTSRGGEMTKGKP